jgi:hypothetical protein
MQLTHPKLESAWFQTLSVSSETIDFAFKFNLYRYTAHSSHRHTPQEVGQMDQTATRWMSMKTLNVGKDFFPSVLHVQVHMSEPVVGL